MADPRGFEPRIAESKSAELPLLHGPSKAGLLSFLYSVMTKPHIGLLYEQARDSAGGS